MGKLDLYNGVLPSHMSLDIWEVYACLVLQCIDNSLYRGLIYSDKPDLVDYNAGLGVEVTQSIDPKNQEANALYSKLISKHDEKARAKMIERIRQIGGEVYDWGLFGPKSVDSFDLTLKAFRSKLEKLNEGGYETFNRNHLFIRSDVLANDFMLRNALQQFRAFNKGNAVFERVVVSAPGRNYVFDLLNRSYVEHSFDLRVQYRIAMRARAIVLATK